MKGCLRSKPTLSPGDGLRTQLPSLTFPDLLATLLEGASLVTREAKTNILTFVISSDK